MGELTEVQRISILRNYLINEAKARSNNNVRWAFSRGVILFPETKCPFCKTILRSTKIWMARDGLLLGCWTLENGKMVKRTAAEIGHPHVWDSAICMGNLKRGEEMAALFLGLSPDPQYTKMRSWLRKEFGHVCSKVVEKEKLPALILPTRADIREKIAERKKA